MVNGACSLAVRDRNKAVGAIHVAFHLPLFKRVEYWLFIGWGFFGIISYIIVVFSLTDYAQKVGFSADQGSVVAAVFNCEFSFLVFLLAHGVLFWLICLFGKLTVVFTQH